MIIRTVRVGDSERIEDILSQHDFEYPTGPVVTEAVVEHQDKVIAYGVVRLIAEEIMILDRNCDIKQKSEVLRLLHRQAIEGCLSQGFDSIHAFVENSHFIEVLKKHYGYKDCKGKAIVMVF